MDIFYDFEVFVPLLSRGLSVIIPDYVKGIMCGELDFPMYSAKTAENKYQNCGGNLTNMLPSAKETEETMNKRIKVDAVVPNFEKLWVLHINKEANASLMELTSAFREKIKKLVKKKTRTEMEENDKKHQGKEGEITVQQTKEIKRKKRLMSDNIRHRKVLTTSND